MDLVKAEVFITLLVKFITNGFYSLTTTFPRNPEAVIRADTVDIDPYEPTKI